MSDLIKCLRGQRIDGRSTDTLMMEAADEIERLRGQLADYILANAELASLLPDQPSAALPPLPDANDADPVRFYRQLSAAYSQRLARAVAYLREVGNDYPGSSCQQWCLQRAAECEVTADPTTEVQK